MKLEYEPWQPCKYWERTIRRCLKWLVGLLLLALLVSAPVCCVHGLLYEHTEELDLYSGRLRTSEYILFVRTNRTVQETAFSAVLLAAMKDTGQADWHPVLTRDRPCFSTHCWIYGGAMGKIKMIGDYWPLFTPEARQQVAATTLSLWRSGDPHDGNEYLDAVTRMALKLPGRKIGVDQLPAGSTTRPSRQ